jgi:hypothetical protein
MASLEEVAGTPPPHCTPGLGVLDPAVHGSHPWIFKPGEEALDEMGRENIGGITAHHELTLRLQHGSMANRATALITRQPQTAKTIIFHKLSTTVRGAVIHCKDVSGRYSLLLEGLECCDD